MCAAVDDTERRFFSLLERLVDATVKRLRYQAVCDHIATTLAAVAVDLDAAKHDIAQALVSETAEVLSLPRARLEELRSLTNPPRVVRESLALLHALLQPEDMLESVEHSSWENLVLLLQHENLKQRIADFAPSDGRSSVLVAVPAIRQVMEVLDVEVIKQHKLQTQQLRTVPKVSMPLSARAPKSFASGMAAKLISPAQKFSGGLAGIPLSSRQKTRLVLCQSDSLDSGLPIADAAGLIELLKERGRIAGIDAVTSMSPIVGSLLRWSLSHLRRIKAHRPPHADARVAAARLEGDDAARSLIELKALEDGLLLEALSALPAPAGARHRAGCGCADMELLGIITGTVLKFSRGSALMSSLAARSLENLVQILIREQHLHIVVLGCGGSSEECTLPLKRAQAVGKYLQSVGVAADRFSMVPVDGAPCVRFTMAETLTLQSSLNFAACSDALMPEAVDILKPVAVILRGAPFLRVSLEGHADSNPMWLGNAALSECRAERVASKLRDLGVLSDQLVTAGHSDRCPAAPNDSADGKALNRRVEVRMLLEESVAQLRLTHRRRDFPAERGRTTLLDLALAAADLSGVADVCGVGELSRPSHAPLSLGLALRVVAAEALVARGAHWGHKLLPKLAWT